MKESDVAKIVWERSRDFNLDFALVMALIKVESNFNERAVSPAGCLGLMQLGRGVCEDYKVSDPFNPEENIRTGCKYLQWLEHCFVFGSALTSSLVLLKVRSLFSRMCFILAAYNWGIGNIAKLQARQKQAGFDPACFICAAKKLPDETKHYVVKILMEVTKNVVHAL